MKQKWHLYRVDWVDSTSRGGWRYADRDRKEHLSAVRCVSTGYLVKRNKREIMLCQSYEESEDRINDTIAIPMGCVQKIRKLKDK